MFMVNITTLHLIKNKKKFWFNKKESLFTDQNWIRQHG